MTDVEGNVRLADFGISRMLNQDESTVKTSRAGTRGWEAAEILKQDAHGKCGYKTSSDIQVTLLNLYASCSEHEKGTYSKKRHLKEARFFHH